MIKLAAPADLETSLRLLAGEVHRFTDPVQLQDVVAGCQVIDVLQAGEHVGSVSIEVQTTSVARLARITGAAAYKGHALTRAALLELEQLARPAADYLEFQTRRGGLVRLAKRAGYTVAGVTLRKHLHLEQ